MVLYNKFKGGDSLKTSEIVRVCAHLNDLICITNLEALTGDNDKVTTKRFLYAYDHLLKAYNLLAPLMYTNEKL